MPRVLAIGLDGYEPTVGDRMMADGELPNLAKLRQASAVFGLDHGSAKRTGLAWEHVSSGKSPDDAQRWSAVNFDAESYEVRQEGVRVPSFLSQLDVPTTVFDLPYFRIEDAPRVAGVTAWGAHDPGVPLSSNPAGLDAEIQDRFGGYPAEEWIYGFAWPSADKCRDMGEALTRATDLRADIGRWLLAERLPDWELGVVVVSELHSVAEGLWHGVDDQHPLAGHESARPAAAGVRNVYRSVDRLVGTMMQAFPDAITVVFSLHGMGTNQSDVPSMVLLPELLFRHAFGKSALGSGPGAAKSADDNPMLAPNQVWDADINPSVGWFDKFRSPPDPWYEQELPQDSLAWMPAARYQPCWQKMRAFALPSFYDGQIRINLRGRESRGRVVLKDYRRVCDEVAELLSQCRDPRSGDPVVEEISYHDTEAPQNLDSSAADMTVVWRGSPLALQHDRLGLIGPVPFRRPGGHTGDKGVAWVRGAGLPVGHYGQHSAFDVVPTIIELLGRQSPPDLTGSSLLSAQLLGHTA